MSSRLTRTVGATTRKKTLRWSMIGWSPRVDRRTSGAAVSCGRLPQPADFFSIISARGLGAQGPSQPVAVIFPCPGLGLRAGAMFGTPAATSHPPAAWSKRRTNMQVRSRQALRAFMAAIGDERRRQTMSALSDRNRAEGVIQTLDPLNREMTLLVGGELKSFYVPLDCWILLNDERVKLRMLQPLDRAVVAFARSESQLVARSIKVAWESGIHSPMTAEVSLRP